MNSSSRQQQNDRQVTANCYCLCLVICAMSQRVVRQEKAEMAANGGNEQELPNVVENGSTMEELRRLLIEPEQKQLTELDSQLGDLQYRFENQPPIQAEEIAPVLPQAVAQSAKQDAMLSQALLAVVEEDIRISVERNPEVLAEALFPAIGPLIRKAIAEALRGMIQSLNKTLDESVSPKSFGWRLEAWQTGKPFAEVVLLHTLLYRVEQVFLIHHETGLMLQHLSAEAVTTQDADMVSAMLTAIQDFVKDSFQNAPDAQLDTLQVGELSVWIERGPHTLLAGVIRGNAPLELRQTFKQSIEKIEYEQRKSLHNFAGDSSVFELSRPHLEECLQQQLGGKDSGKQRIFTPARIIGVLLLITLFTAGFFYVRFYWRWQNYLARLQNEPGIVVTKADAGWFRHYTVGLRDPLARNPNDLLAESNLTEEDVEAHWEEYQALHSNFILPRAIHLLAPPETVKLTFAEGTLKAQGTASPEWIADANKLVRALAGVTSFDQTQLVPIETQNTPTPLPVSPDMRKIIEQKLR